MRFACNARRGSDGAHGPVLRGDVDRPEDDARPPRLKSPPGHGAYHERSSRLRILPTGDFGSSSRKSTIFGRLYPVS